MNEPKHNFLHKLKRAQTELLHTNKDNNNKHRPAILTSIDPPGTSAPLHVRPHEPDMNIVISNPAAQNTTMNDIAFEITSDHYVHPIDQPITLKNGKNLYPGDDLSGLNSPNEKKEGDIDIGKFVSSLVTNSMALVSYIWNMNLYMNLNLAENSKLKIHIPSTVAGVIIVKVVFSFLSSSNTKTIPKQNSQASSFMSSCFHFFLFIIVIYFIISLLKSSPASASSTGNGETAFNTANAKSINIATHQRALKPKLKYEVRTSPSHTIPKLEEFNKIGSKEFRNPSRTPITDYNVLHRNEQRKQNGHLSLNLPLKNNGDNAKYISTTSPPSVLPTSRKNELIRQMTDDAREEMLKRFK